MPDVKIPLVSLYTEETERLTTPVLNEFKSLVESSQFILSEKVTQFENKFKAVAGTKHAVGVNSGLDALILGLRALGIGPGDEVITAPNSFLASAAAIQLVGARTVFADVKEDFNIDPEQIERRITSRTKAVMPVHLTGNMADMDAITEICRRKDIKILEDAAQAVGATYLNKPAGCWGHVNGFSLHPLKNLHVWGDGGMATTSDPELDKNLRLQRNHGLINRDESDFFSYNSRLDSLQAIVGLAFIETLEATNEKRRRNASLYYQRLEKLAPRVKVPIYNAEKSRPVFHVFQLRAEKRNELQAYLMSEGIESKLHYPLPIHLQKAAKELGYKQGDFPVCERLAGEILSIPVRENLTAKEIHQVCDAIEAFYTKN